MMLKIMYIGIGRTARADRTGEAITFINPKQVKILWTLKI